jgi:hypothetical protein
VFTRLPVQRIEGKDRFLVGPEIGERQRIERGVTVERGQVNAAVHGIQVARLVGQIAVGIVAVR